MARRNPRRDPDQTDLDGLWTLVKRHRVDEEWEAFRPIERVDDPRGLFNATTVESEA